MRHLSTKKSAVGPVTSCLWDETQLPETHCSLSSNRKAHVVRSWLHQKLPTRITFGVFLKFGIGKDETTRSFTASNRRTSDWVNHDLVAQRTNPFRGNAWWSDSCSRHQRRYWGRWNRCTTPMSACKWHRLISRESKTWDTSTATKSSFMRSEWFSNLHVMQEQAFQRLHVFNRDEHVASESKTETNVVLVSMNWWIGWKNHTWSIYFQQPLAIRVYQAQDH